jgi:biotin synthase
MIDSILHKCVESGDLTREEIIYLLSLDNPEDIKNLYAAADAVRQKYCGNDVHIRGLIEFSNNCRKNCCYCGIRRDNRAVKRYRMSPDEIVEVAQHLDKKGIRTVVLQSGEDPWYTVDKLCEIIRRIKETTSCAVTLCVGERPVEEYIRMKEAGADRYLLRHETADPELYTQIHPDSKFEDRQACLASLLEIGFQTGAGCMVGIPGQTIEHMAKDILLLKRLRPHMVGIGPFIPHPDTPLGDAPQGNLEMTLKMVALARIVTRDALIPATTAVGSIDEYGREKALQAGANVVMPNHTPVQYRESYEIYPNKRCVNEDPEKCHGCLAFRIHSVGRTIAKDQGHSPRMI